MRSIVLLSVLFFSSACHTAASPGPPPAVAPQAAPPTSRVVNATILANGCQDLGARNARLAERAMYDLVEGCSTVPTNAARFFATLHPDGRIELEAAPGQPAIVPICVVKHPLMHKVTLSKPCRLDVRLEESTVPLTRAADAGGDAITGR